MRPSLPVAAVPLGRSVNRPPPVDGTNISASGRLELFGAYSDARETLDVRLAIEQGREDYSNGRTIPWEKARRELLTKARPPARRKRR